MQKSGKQYKSKEYENGDTLKQLLGRSRYILAKKEEKWTENQNQRALYYSKVSSIKKSIQSLHAIKKYLRKQF